MPRPCKLTFDLESDVRVTCDVGYLCANFSLPRPLCSRLRPDVRDRQTDVRRASSLIAPNPGRGITTVFRNHVGYVTDVWVSELSSLCNQPAVSRVIDVIYCKQAAIVVQKLLLITQLSCLFVYNISEKFAKAYNDPTHFVSHRPVCNVCHFYCAVGACEGLNIAVSRGTYKAGGL